MHTLPDHSKRVVEQENWLQNPEFLTRNIDALNRTARETIANNWRIYCLARQPDLLLMWSHYADKHKGICLEFDATLPEVGAAFEVSYQEQRPVVTGHQLTDEHGMTEKILLTKSSDWSYECEYRLLARTGEFDLHSLASLPKTTGDFLQLPEGALTGIILGCCSDAKCIKEVVRTCRPLLKIYQAIPDGDHYRLTIEPDVF